MGDVRRLIAFDLDGTLVESRRDLADSANELIGELGGTPLSLDAIGGMVGEGAALLVRRALEAAGLEFDPGALTRFLQIYDTRLLDHTYVYAGIPDAVRLAGRHARVAVLTNKPRDASERILSGLGIRDLFAEVIGGDGPHPRKPDPASLLELMARAGAAPAHTMLVGDSAIDRETARRASARCCLVSYGFGFRNEGIEGADWIADAPEGIARAIDAFTVAS